MLVCAVWNVGLVCCSSQILHCCPQGGKVLSELQVLRIRASQQGCVSAGAGRSSQVTGTGRAGKQGVCEAGFGGCLCCNCVSSNKIL